MKTTNIMQVMFRKFKHLHKRILDRLEKLQQAK